MPENSESVHKTVLPNSNRSGIALCLSGGGFRATLFHLGAVRRLHELGVFQQVNTITSVSGGSIFAAFLARELCSNPAIADYETQIAKPVRNFCAEEMRTWAAVKSYIIPVNWFRPNVGTNALTKRYSEAITPMTLGALPERPRFIFCATDMVFMVNWVFERVHVGDYQAGYMTPSNEWTVAKAVAASSCFPPVFRAMRLHLRGSDVKTGNYHGADRDALISAINLSDGGVYDNMGLEPVWKDHDTVLVSDGGGSYAFESPALPHKQLGRYISVARNQALALRKRWLITNFSNPAEHPVMRGAYWSVRTEIKGYSANGIVHPGYPDDIAALAGNIRTDLDAFSEAEQKVLENHGYALANAAIDRYCSKLQSSNAPFNAPHPKFWGADTHQSIREHLARSHKRNYLGRRG